MFFFNFLYVSSHLQSFEKKKNSASYKRNSACCKRNSVCRYFRLRHAEIFFSVSKRQNFCFYIACICMLVRAQRVIADSIQLGIQRLNIFYPAIKNLVLHIQRPKQTILPQLYSLFCSRYVIPIDIIYLEQKKSI